MCTTIAATRSAPSSIRRSRQVLPGFGITVPCMDNVPVHGGRTGPRRIWAAMLCPWGVISSALQRSKHNSEFGFIVVCLECAAHPMACRKDPSADNRVSGNDMAATVTDTRRRRGIPFFPSRVARRIQVPCADAGCASHKLYGYSSTRLPDTTMQRHGASNEHVRPPNGSVDLTQLCV